MIAQSETLHLPFAEIVGAEHVRPATDRDVIDGVQPRLVVEPGSPEETARVLKAADERGLKVVPRGNGSKLGWGRAARTVDLVLSLRRQADVLEHAWGDMTATVQAGCTVGALQRVLSEHGQRLPLDPLWPDVATIGGVLATNDSGSLRVRFGSMRDLLLGVTLALPDGTVARSGGKVVKNVAGYDLPKLVTGALGTLGVIVEATVRLYPVAVEPRTVSYRAPNVAAANRLLLQILDSTLVPTGVQLRAGADEALHVDVRFEGLSAAVESQLAQLANFAGASDVGATATDETGDVWQARDALWQGDALIAKLSVLPTDIGAAVETVQRLAGPLRLRWSVVHQALGLGFLRLEGANPEVLLTALMRLRAELQSRSGSLVVLRCAPEVKQRLDVWGASGDALPLMRRVKSLFDPNATLNPGRFVTD